MADEVVALVVVFSTPVILSGWNHEKLTKYFGITRLESTLLTVQEVQ